MNRRWYVCLFVVLGLVPTALVGYREMPRPFSSVAWINAPEDNDRVRARMGQDLTSGHLRESMTKEQVLDLLGPPDQEGYDKAWIFILGFPLLSLDFDPDYLNVRFDDSGRLLEARVLTG